MRRRRSSGGSVHGRGNCACDHRGKRLHQMPWRSARFALVEAATRTDFEGLGRNNVGLPLPVISQVTAVDDQFGAHTAARCTICPWRGRTSRRRPSVNPTKPAHHRLRARPRSHHPIRCRPAPHGAPRTPRSPSVPEPMAAKLVIAAIAVFLLIPVRGGALLPGRIQ